MTEVEIKELAEEFEKQKEAYLRGEISDDMTPDRIGLRNAILNLMQKYQSIC